MLIGVFGNEGVSKTHPTPISYKKQLQFLTTSLYS